MLCLCTNVDSRPQGFQDHFSLVWSLRVLRLLPLLLLMTLPGCAAPQWLTMTWGIIRVCLGAVIVWTLLFGVLGLLAAFGVFFLLRAMRGYQWGWPPAKWFRLFTLILMILALPVLFGMIGALQGAYFAAEKVLTECKPVKELYTVVGSVAADAIAAVYIVTPQLSNTVTDLDVQAISFAELETFRSEQWEISVPDLAYRLANTGDEVLQSAVDRVSSEARERIHALDSGLGSWMLTTSLNRVLVPVLQNAVAQEVDSSGIPAVRGALLQGLADVAEEQEPPETIGRSDLSEHLVLNWIVGPFLLHPFRMLIRGKQLVLWGIVGIVIVVPVIFFQVAHAIWRARAKKRVRTVNSGEVIPGREETNLR